MINNLNPEVRSKVSRCVCNLTFRFGNQGLLHSEYALVVPIHGCRLKVAVVPGATPFLLSNTLLRTLGAVIDTQKQVLIAKTIGREFPLQLSPKGLFLIDVNDLASDMPGLHPEVEAVETHTAYESKRKTELASVTHPAPPADDVPYPSFRNLKINIGEAPIDPKHQKPCQPSFSPQQSLGSKDFAQSFVCWESPLMSSLAHRLQRVQQEATVPLPEVEGLSIHQLENRRIEFGKAHLGKTFLEVWQGDQRWITWFVQHYQNSQKLTHRTFLHYVNLMVERAELTGEPIMVTPAKADLQVNNLTTGKGRGKSLPKAKAKSVTARPKAQARSEHAQEFEDLMANNFEFEEDMASFEMIEQPAPDVSHLETRMLHLESALTRVIQHLEAQGTQASESQEA